MTILTKGFTEKKDKLVVPLVGNETQDLEPNAPSESNDIEAQTGHRRIIILPGHARRVSSSTIFCLLIIALAGVSVGIIGGKILYNQYLSVSKRYSDYEKNAQGWVKIPLSESNDILNIRESDEDDVSNWNDVLDEEDRQMWKKVMDPKYFQENFEIDPDNKYEKIDVPDFKNGRNGRFVHDFNTNYTGIIDVSGGRCFVMPLNRGNILPPRSLFDLVKKMWEGYYKVNTEIIRETMRVVTPPITDLTDIGQYISTECENLPIYRLEKYVGGVSKRSVQETEMKFGQFAGKGVLELDIINMDAVLAYEKENSNAA